MNKPIANAGVILGGVASSAFTVAIVAVFDQLTGMNLFTFSLWVVIPVGAALCGAVAASGYYIASIGLHRRPTAVLLVQMIAIAAITQLAIYYVEYQTLVVDGIRVADVVPFFQYLDISLTSAHLQSGRVPALESGEIGSFGYWLAVIQFAGFLAGAVGLYLLLKQRMFCADCKKYYAVAKRKKDVFETEGEFLEYFDAEFSDPIDSQEFAERASRGRDAKAEQGAIRLTTDVLECSGCSKQLVWQTVDVHNGSEWKRVDELSRGTQVPEGHDLAAVYGGKKPSFVQTILI